MTFSELYHIKELHCDDGLWRAVVELAAKHPIYEGHFPGNPVLPGVCTLEIVKECVERAGGCSVRYDNIADCKFTAMIIPGKEVLSVEFTLGEDRTVRATVSVGGTAAMKLKATYAKL